MARSPVLVVRPFELVPRLQQLARDQRRLEAAGVTAAANALLGDLAVCVGPPDSIIKGSATVMIMGLPAARLGDSTAHGGAIVIGFPTVLIGG